MKTTKRLLCLLLCVALLLVGCSTTSQQEDAAVQTALDKIDASSWNYNEEDDVYWQVGIAYCENPADTAYETLGIFVPGAYMTASDNGDGTYTCQINTEASISGYTAQTAPMVIPVDTPGYSAMKAPTDYVSAAVSYTDAGFIYINAGCRGRDAGAPAGVTDLKAAIRYIRYNAETIPGSVERIFSFGMSGGGAQSALLGATGDSELYTPYLEAIGAVSGITLSGTYNTAQDYIDALNAEQEWVHYDSQTNTATITSIADFVQALKPASKNIGAFDDLQAEQGENVLFGYGDGTGSHFDAIMAALLQDNAQYGEAYANDLQKTDALGNTVAYRLNIYNPMYYLEDYYDGYQTANVASYWRIRTGINQGDTALCTEVNLALALQNYGVDVDFATVWGQGHVEAERTDNSTDNFIAWVNQCLQ